MQEWSGNQLYSPLDHMQGQLVQMQNTENLHNAMALHDPGLQQSQQLVQGPYDSQHVAQMQGQGVHYPQGDAGQHALQGGQSQPTPGQGFQYSQPDAGHGQLYNQTQTQGLYGDWHGNQLYPSVDPAQHLVSMQNTDTLQNVAFQDHGLQQSQQLVQMHGQSQGVHYPQADVGQHALQGGEFQHMQGQVMQYPQADGGQHALHTSDFQQTGLQQTWDLIPGVHGTEYLDTGQLQVSTGIPGMTEGHAAAISAGASLGASLVGAVSAAKVAAKSTAKSGKHKHFSRSSSSSTSSLIPNSDADPHAGIQEEGPSQTFGPYSMTPIILSSTCSDNAQPSSSQTSSPSSVTVTPFKPLPLPRYAPTDYTEPLKSSSGQRSSKADP